MGRKDSIEKSVDRPQKNGVSIEMRNYNFDLVAGGKYSFYSTVQTR